MKAFRTWTQDEMRKLRMGLEDGFLVSDIAATLGRTLASVYRKITEMDLWAANKRPWTKGDLRVLREMRSQGATYQAIGKTIGRKTSAVQAMARRTFATHPKSAAAWMGAAPWTPRADAVLTRMRADGYTTAEIATALGRAKHAVRCRARDTGLPLLKPGRRPPRLPARE